MPVCFLKYLAKKDGLVKLSVSEICNIVKSEFFSCALASKITASFIRFRADLPLISFITTLRYLADIHSLSA